MSQPPWQPPDPHGPPPPPSPHAGDTDPYAGQWGQHQQLRPYAAGNDYGAPPSNATLIWAGVLQIIMSSIFAIIGVVVVILGALVEDAFDDVRWLDDSDTDTVAAVLIVIGIAMLAIAVTMIVLAAYAMRRSNGARISSAVLEAIFAVFALLSVVSAFGGDDSPLAVLLLLAGTGTAATLYLLPASADACRGDKRFRG